MNIDSKTYGNCSHHKYDVRELVLQENAIEDFKRYDIIILLLAIENYYGKNDYGFELCKKIQNSVEDKENATDCLLSILQSGKYYNDDALGTPEIGLDQKLHVLKGNYRIALALYYKEFNVYCKVFPGEYVENRGIDWLVEHDFTNREIYNVRCRLQLLLQNIQVPFVCVLWASAERFFDPILDRLESLAEVVEFKDFSYGINSYTQMVRKIYSVDDIAKWKVEEKIKHICSTQGEINTIRVIIIHLPCPNYRRKRSNGNLISMRGEEIKRIIRSVFKNKLEDYYYDNIIHLGDNFFQNHHLARLFGLCDRTIKTQ